MVVQFGLAMMPLRASAIACGLTSLTTSGTSGSMRNAEELSMTVTPAAANRGACARDVVAPAEKIAMSSPVGSAVEASSTVICSPLNSSVVPALRALAKKRISAIGTSRSTRRRRTTAPTWPVAPTTPIRTGMLLVMPIILARPMCRLLRPGEAAVLVKSRCGGSSGRCRHARRPRPHRRDRTRCAPRGRRR